MAGNCYICGCSYNTTPSLEQKYSNENVQGDNSSEHSLVSDVFIRFVLRLPAPASPQDKSSIKWPQVTFCVACAHQLNLLRQMELQIQNMQTRCAAVKESLLTSTLSTIITVGLRESSSMRLFHGCGSRKIVPMNRYGHLASKISKEHVLGFRIYRKWRNRFVKLLRNHLMELNLSGTSDNCQPIPLTDNNAQTQSQRLEEHVPHALKMDGTHSVPVDEQASSRNGACPQFDHSYSVKALMTPLHKKEPLLGCRRRHRRVRGLIKTENENVLKQKQDDGSVHEFVKSKGMSEYGPLKENQTSASADEIHSIEGSATICGSGRDVPAKRDCQKSITTEIVDPSINTMNSPTRNSNTSQINQMINKRIQEETKTDKAKVLASHSEKTKPFECDNCKKVFNSKKQLKIHKKIHGGEKKYLCDSCGSLFLSLASLHSHRKTHLGLKPYKCQTCQCSFRSSGHLSKHSLIHSGEKPFSCSVCDKLFNRKENLRVHEFTHAAVKPYKCTKCDNASFTRAILLQRHELEKHPSPSPSSAPRRKRISRSSGTNQVPVRARVNHQTTFLVQYEGQEGTYEGVLPLPYASTAGPEYDLVVGTEDTTATYHQGSGNDYVQHTFVLPDGQYLIIH